LIGHTQGKEETAMRARTNGIDINYVIEGDGPWLVMSHSLACNIGMWDPQAPALAKRFKVLRFDTRGHGASDAPAGDYSLDMLADDVKGLFDHLGIRECHWVGLSMGGMIGQTFALKYPGIFKSITLCDTASRYPAGAAEIWAGRVKVAREQGMEALVPPTLERWFTEGFRKSQPAKVSRIADSIRQTPVNGYAGCCAALPKIDTTDRLKDIKCPALIICGEQDMGTPLAMSQAIHAAMPGSTLAVLPNAAHISNVEQPELFSAALDPFLAKVAA
jgi:3-oxoadipate enol-lactonase